MKDEVKNQFDALAAFRDHAWKEFQDKSGAEWRLSLAVWAAILSAAGAVLSRDGFKPPTGAVPVSGLVLLSVGGLHLWFLHWVQRKLGEARRFLSESQARMRELAGLPATPVSPRGSPWKQPTLYVQLAITVVVGCVFIAALIYKAGLQERGSEALPHAVYAIAQENIALPDGWRYPTTEELSDEPGRKDSPTKLAKAIADFNGDGINDEAFLLKSTKFSGEGLFVHLSDKQKVFRWIKLDVIDWGPKYPKVNLSMGISIAKPGKYKTACGKGYFECKKDEPEVIQLKQPALDYFKFESANSFFVWDEKTAIFKRIWMSD